MKILILLIFYIYGSIPFGLIFVKKSKGIDIRKVGSGNIGATNVLRVAGFSVALLSGLFDLSKGLLPVLLGKYLFHFDGVFLFLSGFSGILGHDFSIFLKFKGGKGIATTFGIWSALTKYEVPMLLGLIYTIFIFIKAKDTSPEFDMIRALTGMIFVMVYVRIFYPQFFAISLLNFILLCFSHRKEIYNLVKNRQI